MIRRFPTFIVAALALAISAAAIPTVNAATPAAASPLLGSWTVEQVPPGGAQHSAGTMAFSQSGSDLNGVLRVGGNQLSLSDIDDTGGIVSFTVVIPGNITLHYVGAFMGDELGLASEDEGKGSYTLTARRAGAAAAPQTRAGLAPPAPRAGPAPQAAPPPGGDYITRLLGQNPAPAASASPPIMTGPPPAPPPRVASASPPPAPRPAAPRPAPAPALGPSLEGNWNAQQTRPGSATQSATTLIFTRSGNGLAGMMRSGGEEMPLFDVILEGRNVSFTLVIPGTPYVTVHYKGTLEGNRLQLASLNEGQGVFKLDAARVGASAPPLAPPALSPLAAAPTPAAPTPAASKPPASPPASAQPRPAQQTPQVASAVPSSPSTSLPVSVPPPTAVPAPPAPATPSPASARPVPPLASAPAAPSAKLPLPALRDLPPNNLAKTPLMGWASRQKLGTRMTDKEIRGAADVLVESGLRAAGYVYVEVDDGWQGVRDGDGVLHPNERFPDMKALADYIHSKGLKFGLSTSAAPKSCDGFEGSYGRETEDAKAFAEWGVDHVVYDWCGAETIYPTQSEMQGAYQKMGMALRSSDRDIVYGISAAGAFEVAQWGAKAGANVWRSGKDIDEDWKSVADAGFGQNGKEGAAGPGRWNDPGLLQAGNIGMTPDENRMQLNLWAMLAAPLILGNDLRVLNRETVALLTNRDVIAVDQDALGRQGKRVAQAGNGEVWARPLADGSVAVAFFNKGNQSAAVAVSWEQLGLEGPRQVRDLWWHENVGRANNNYVVFLQPHTSLLLKMSRP